MKRIFYIAFLLCAYPALATNALLDLKDARLSVGVYSNRVVVLQPMSTPTVSSPSVVLGSQIVVTNDSNGQNWYSNIYSGLYHVTVMAPPDRADFAFLITATNLGNINVADNLVAASTATFPAGSVAWAAAVTDGRYSRGTNAPVSFYNVTNALGYTPQPSSPNLTNWSVVTTNGLLTLPYIGNSSGSGTNTLLDWVSSSDYSTFIHPYSTTGVELLYEKNDLSSAAMLWRSIGSQLYINNPIISGATLNGNVVGTFVGDGSGLTNLTPQAGFQFGSLALTNTSLYFGLNHETLLGSSTNGTPIAYTAGTDLQIVPGILTYTLNSTAASTVTNGLGVAVSNYVLTVSQNATNQSLKIGNNATNDDLLFGLNSTNQSLLIGANATNDDLLFGVNSTNQSLLIGSRATNEATRVSNNATNQSLLIGANGTNQSLLIGLGATNEAFQIGANGTNEALLIGLNATNEALLIGSRATNESTRISQNATNQSLLASNNLNIAKQQGSAVLTNISGASGTPSSSTFLRGDYSWQPASSGGASWSLTGNTGTLPGTDFLGTSDNQPIMFKVNAVQAAIFRGGGSVVIGDSGSAAGNADAVLAGHNNSILSFGATTYNVIAGGVNNSIVPNTVGNSILGGSGNAINSPGGFSTIAGGQNNTASGSSSFIAGGNGNVASGLDSFAAGLEAHAVHQGAFVWADSQSIAFPSTNNDSFNIRAQGGVILSQTPLFAQTNYAPYATLTNPVTSGVNWTNKTGARVQLFLDYTLTGSAISGFPGLCITNTSTGEWFNATNAYVLTVASSGRTSFLMSPNDVLIVTNKSSNSASATLDASWGKVQ